MLDHILNNKEGLTGSMKLTGSLGYSEHETQPWTSEEMILACSQICLVES